MVRRGCNPTHVLVSVFGYAWWEWKMGRKVGIGGVKIVNVYGVVQCCTIELRCYFLGLHFSTLGRHFC